MVAGNIDLTTLTIVMSAMQAKEPVSIKVAKRLGITTTTLYAYVNSDGLLKELGTKLLEKFSEHN